MGLVVDAHGVVVLVVVVDPSEPGTAEVEPFKALSECPAIVDLVQQVIDVTKRVASGNASVVLGVKNVGLADVGQLLGQATDQHDVLDTAAFQGNWRQRLTETPQDGVVQERPVIVDLGLDTADVSRTVVDVTAVPTRNPAIEDLGVIVDFVCGQCTGVGERLCVIERELAAIEEVAGGLNDFVTDNREELTHFDAQVTEGCFTVDLWQRITVCETVVPAIVPGVVSNTEGLGVGSIGTVQIVDPSAESEPIASVRNALSVEPLLLQLNVTRVVVEAEVVGFGMVANAGPATDGDASDGLAAQLPGVAEIAAGADQSHAEKSGRAAAKRIAAIGIAA